MQYKDKKLHAVHPVHTTKGTRQKGRRTPGCWVLLPPACAQICHSLAKYPSPQISVRASLVGGEHVGPIPVRQTIASTMKETSTADCRKKKTQHSALCLSAYLCRLPSCQKPRAHSIRADELQLLPSTPCNDRASYTDMSLRTPKRHIAIHGNRPLVERDHLAWQRPHADRLLLRHHATRPTPQGGGGTRAEHTSRETPRPRASHSEPHPRALRRGRSRPRGTGSATRQRK